MKVIKILNHAKRFIDRYSTMDAIKIAIHAECRKLITTEELIKNIPEIVDNDLDSLIEIYNDSSNLIN